MRGKAKPRTDLVQEQYVRLLQRQYSERNSRLLTSAKRTNELNGVVQILSRA
jgi:hypothetical protein